MPTNPSTQATTGLATGIASEAGAAVLLLVLGLLDPVLVAVSVWVVVLLDSVVAVVEETVLVVRPDEEVDVVVAEVVLVDSRCVSLRIDVKESVAAESFE